MDGTGFLRTVRVGGFDKKDVLAYIDELNSKIYALEDDLEKARALQGTGGGDGSESSEKYEQLLEADKAKITELQTANDSLKLQIKSAEDELAEKDRELEDAKAHIAELEDQLQEAKNNAAASASSGGGDNSALDLSNVFIEAQKTATTIVTQAKENARKMDEDAKKLANQVVDDANGKASTIVKNADERASKILAEAADRSSEMREAADKIRREVEAEITEIDENIVKLKEVLEMFSDESLERLKDAKTQIDNAQRALKRGDVPAGGAPAAARAPGPAPAAEPEPEYAPEPETVEEQAAESEPEFEPEPVSQPAAEKPKPAFAGFDMSELENLAKAAEAEGMNPGNINMN